MTLTRETPGTASESAQRQNHALRSALDEALRESLRPCTAILGVLYAIIAPSHLWLLPPGTREPLSIVAGLTAVSLIGLAGLFGRWKPRASWLHPMAAGIAGMVLVNSLLVLYLQAEAIQTTNLMLLVIGSGLIFLSLPWLLAVLLSTVLGWSAVAAVVQPSPGWVHFGFALLSSIGLSVMLHIMRVRTISRQAGLRLRDERRNAQLEAALRQSQQEISERKKIEAKMRELNELLEMRVQQVRERTVELTARLEERDILLREIHHRVKNNLQLVSSLMNMQEYRLDDGRARQALQDCQNRVQTMALIHEQLYHSKNLGRVPLSEYARSLAANVFGSVGALPGLITLEVEIEDLYLAVNRAIPCGLILNELVTNALKHAFPEGRTGVVRVELRRAASSRFVLLVSDDGVGLPPSVDVRQTDSLGLQLVCTLADQLRGELRVERGAGTSFRLEFDGDA